MLLTSPRSAPRLPAAGRAPWPALGLARAEVLVADADEQLVEGALPAGDVPVAVGLRDLGEGVSASLWQDEVQRLATLVHPAAARVLSARIHADRVVVLTTERPAGTPLRALLREGPLDAATAEVVLRDALALMHHLHGLGLSAAGAWLRGGALVDGGRRFVLATFGLRVDLCPDARAELRELATRVLTTIGSRVAAGRPTFPARALAPRVEAALRRALGEGRPFRAAAEMAEAMGLGGGAR